VTAGVFFDRDGVVNQLVRAPYTGLWEAPVDAGEVELIPGAAAALRRLRGAGYALVGISNQPAAAKGTVPLAALESIQARVLELLEHERVVADSFRLCFHHPDGTVVGLAGPCTCRKPAPGMLLGAARELGIDLRLSWMIGDTDGDVEAGTAAGCRTILVENPASAHKRSSSTHPDARARDLMEAVGILLDAEASRLTRA
jgi:D-glycero-D-manno-heptose 1,7-bisphosphate phosphatase